MLEIKDIIRQLSAKEFDSFYESLSDKKADKSIRLLEMIREDKSNDRVIMNELNVNSTAYYTLRSRLNDKLQEFLLTKVKGAKLELLEKVNNIDHIVFNYNKTQAVSILKKLEMELVKFEQPTYLINVYNALKRLSKNSTGYYNYSQQYNQHIAFLLDYDKLVDYLGDFTEILGKYYLSRMPEYLDQLNFIVEQIDSQNQVRESHRMTVVQAIVHIGYQLSLAEEDQTLDLEPVEDILHKVYAIFNEHTDDIFYSNLLLLIDYLSFEYYHKYNIKKKEEEYFIIVNEEATRFINSYGYYIIPTFFLISRLRRAIRDGKETELEKFNSELKIRMEIAKDDLANYVNSNMYLAYTSYYAKKYEDSVTHLNEIWNNVSFKTIPHAELEVKMFLALNYCILNEYELASSLLKSVGRKVLTHQHYDYQNAKQFKKLLQLCLGSPPQEKNMKIKKLTEAFKACNYGKYAILPLLKLDDSFVERLKS